MPVVAWVPRMERELPLLMAVAAGDFVVTIAEKLISRFVEKHHDGLLLVGDRDFVGVSLRGLFLYMTHYR